jgi:hypothetical protein
MFNANFINKLSINFPKESNIFGYICIYNDNAIYKDNKIIDMKINLKNHSPSGLSWGYNGSGCLQAALAILCDFSNDEKFALENYIDFKNEVMCNLPQKDCILKYSDIQQWVNFRKLINYK